MTRWLLLGTCLVPVACGTPSLPAGSVPLSAEQVPGIASGTSSDAPPATLLLRGLRAIAPRRGWVPNEERPDWLPTLPQPLERYPVPQHWHRDTLAKLPLR